MGLVRKKGKHHIVRFREFDEARAYIENFQQYDKDCVRAAVDYMIAHQEYYFLLKNVWKHQYDPQIEDFVHYLFSRLECLKREEDKEMLLNLLYCKNSHVQNSVFVFIISCCEEYEISQLLKDYTPSNDQIAYLVENRDCPKVAKYLTTLQEDLLHKLEIIKSIQ